MDGVRWGRDADFSDMQAPPGPEQPRHYIDLRYYYQEKMPEVEATACFQFPLYLGVMRSSPSR
jgi:hypothetical protein